MKNMTSHILRVLLSVFISAASFSYTANAQETVVVRSGDHPTYSRIVFDWARNVNYSAELVNGDLEIIFDANAVPDFTSVLMDGPSFLSNPSYSADNGNLKVIFKANANGRVRHFRSGAKIVVDLMVNETSVAASVTAIATPIPVVTVVEPAQEPASSDIGSDVSVIASTETMQAISNDDELTIRASTTNDVFTVNYIWRENVKAAAFIRSNTLWVVFDKFAVANHDDLNSILGDRVKSYKQITDINPTILTYSIEPSQNARMVKISNGWQVSLRSNLAVPQLPIEIGHQSISSVGENIFLMASKLGDIITVEDPFIGDDLTIVTASQSSQGVMEQNNYPEFNILKSAQGIALQLIADDIFVTRHETGIAVSGKNGLAVSRSSVPMLREALPVANDGGGENIAQMLLDFEKWGIGPLPREGYTKNRHELLYQLSTSEKSDRNEARWNLAIYNIANNNSAEAIGILALMAESEPAFIENPSYRAALAVSNIKLRRFDEAIKLLNHKSLVAELDALLWRSRAYEAKGEHQKAMDDFNVGVDVLSLQTNDNRAMFLFSAIRTANMLGDVEFMNNQINIMAIAKLNAKQLTELDYWRGKLAEKHGDDVGAGQAYDKVIATGVRYPSSMAKFARINQQYRLKEIEAMQAIDELEKLRFAWRGDAFELDLLKQLGELYVEHNEYREGLSTLRQAATYFPKSPKTQELTRKMSEIYNDLFLHGDAESMSPLKAMALFLEFRELTPLGANGDTMSRSLANRMVSVDLLNDAAGLLEHQVKNRLQGVARADIASDLAMIYVMNKEPQKALDILRATRQSQMPDDIEFGRNMIEIRSLVELGSYEEAEVMLEGINGETADSLRSDIYWKTENWNNVVNHGYQSLGQRWSDSAELDEAERQIVLRIAVALALDENLSGLENIRSQYLDHMENGLFAVAFEMITAKEQKTGSDIRQLTQTIASVDRLETFMNSYRSEFSGQASLN
ncbi:MAG: hypothetical protein JKY84_01995 [Emcibacteraceae bacterium]|nr:hypothetical protein [Emcibacteraceae bacterium]